MVERQSDKPSDKPEAATAIARARQAEFLPYRIELWVAADRIAVERLLGRAASLALARAIFKSALGEHPGRRITLSHRSRIIDDSDD